VEDVGGRAVLQQLAGVQHRGVPTEQQRLGGPFYLDDYYLKRLAMAR
jgi:hypothetical protein